MERGKKGGAREKEREKIHLLVAKEIGHSVSKSSGPEGNGGKKTDSGTRTDCHWLPQTSLPARNRQQRLWMLVRARQQGLGSRSLLLKGSQVCIFGVRI